MKIGRPLFALALLLSASVHASGSATFSINRNGGTRQETYQRSELDAAVAQASASAKPPSGNPVIVVHPTPLDLTGKRLSLESIGAGDDVNRIEPDFDLLCRRTGSGTQDGTVMEVDGAFSARGFAAWMISVAPNGAFQLPRNQIGEKVFAIGHRGAVDFAGKLSNQGGARFYCVVYASGFIQNFGIDIGNAPTPSDETFGQKYAPRGKMFVIRHEKSTAALGQVHTQNKGGWLNMEVVSPDGSSVRTTHFDFFRSYALGMFEFDEHEAVTEVRAFAAAK